MKHVITRHDDRIEIHMTGIGNDSRYFLGGAGHCCNEEPCSHDRYKTLESLATTRVPDGVQIELKAKPATELDLDEAEQCLDNAVEKILAQRDRSI